MLSISGLSGCVQWACWFATAFTMLLIVIIFITTMMALPAGGITPLLEYNAGLFFATLVFYAISFLLSMFVVATIFNSGESKLDLKWNMPAYD